jgi:hypothetical protein
MVDGRTHPPFGRGAVTYARQLARVMAGIEREDFESKDIERGNKLEDEAILHFERTFFIEVERPDFMVHPDIEYFGGTPDGKTSDFGLDVKCPNQKNHHDNLSEGMQLSKYEGQFQSYMAITGLDRWALVSYNRDFNDKSKLAVAWMERDQEYIDKLLKRVKKFYPLVQKEYKKLTNYKPQLTQNE